MKKILYATSLVFLPSSFKIWIYGGNIMLYRISVAERGLTGIANIFRSRLRRLDDLLRAGTVPLIEHSKTLSFSLFLPPNSHALKCFMHSWHWRFSLSSRLRPDDKQNLWCHSCITLYQYICLLCLLWYKYTNVYEKGYQLLEKAANERHLVSQSQPSTCRDSRHGKTEF